MLLDNFGFRGYFLSRVRYLYSYAGHQGGWLILTGGHNGHNRLCRFAGKEGLVLGAVGCGLGYFVLVRAMGMQD